MKTLDRFSIIAMFLLPISIVSVNAEIDQRGYDVTHYNLAIEVADSTVAGVVALDCLALEDGLTDIVLDLCHEMNIDSLFCSTDPVASNRFADDLITITLTSPLTAGEAFSIEIFYHGQPPARYGQFNALPFTFSTHGSELDGTLAPIIFSMSVTDRSSTWWPCKDEIYDKATIDLLVTVPDTLTVLANGILVGTEPVEGDKVKYHWAHGHPVAPYLISLAISNYVVIEDSVEIVAGDETVSVPLYFYIYPEHETEARYDFARVGEMMQFLSSLFGPYPFRDEKYATAIVPARGGMEHQTCTSLGQRFITGDRANEWVYVHELAHQWVGDWVGIGDWREIWLNEGFATYCEALWVEHDQGEVAYNDYMNKFDPLPPPDLWGFRGTIYDPDPLFGTTPYDKGAWVLHMLRRVCGDDHFFEILHTWIERFGGEDVVDYEDFISLCEEITTLELSSFFDQWLYYPSRPLYEYHWGYTDVGLGYEVILHVTQTQEQLDVYTMPIDIQIDTMTDRHNITVTNDQRDQEFTHWVDSKPTALYFDPGNWILKPVFPPDPVNTELYAPVPTPCKTSCLISFNLAHEADLSLRIFDINGRVVRTLVNNQISSGEHLIDWDCRDNWNNPLPAGIFYLQLQHSGKKEERRLVLIQ